MSVGTRGISVTGLGATTPLGGDVASTWAALLAGRSGVRRLTGDWTAAAPVSIGAPIVVEPEVTAPKFRLRRMDRSQQLAFVAAHEAWRDAGFAFADRPGYQVDFERLAVSVASSVGGILTALNGIDAYPETGWKKVSPFSIPKLMPNGAAGLLSVEFKARAGAHAPTSACASSAEAIGLGIDMIRSGRADIVITGGTDAALHEFNLCMFDAMGALSNRNDEPERASRPFDKGRDGFVLGEGAGIVILESQQHARARGARIYATVGGVGYSSDAYDIARPEPTGAIAAKGIGRALRDAGLEPTDIAHINAHGSATPAGDLAEATAIRTALGAHTDQVAVTATKSMTGQLLGGAGAVECIATVLALANGVAPPTINLDDPDDEIALDVAQGDPRPLPPGPIAALSNSFGFGGHNVTLAFHTA